MKRNKQIGCVSVLFFLAFIGLAASTLPAAAVSTYWKADPATPASWQDPLNWTVRVPIAGDVSRIDNGGTALISADFAASYVSAGYSATGHIEQNAGIGAISTYLCLGYNAGSTGTYNLNGGHLSATSQYIGYVPSLTHDPGTGNFIQTGGINEVRYLYVNESSSYTISGGTLSISDSADIHGSFEFADSAWSLNVNGGIANFSQAVIAGAGMASFSSAVDTLTIFPAGFDPSSFGFYSASGLVHVAGCGPLVINAGEGFSGQGTFEITDPVENMGTIVAKGEELRLYFYGGLSVRGTGRIQTPENQELYLYLDKGAVGTLEDDGIILATGLTIGKTGGPGSVFTQSGGTGTIDGSIFVGYVTGAAGTYNLDDGQLSASEETVGFRGGSGVFTQSGGSNATVTLYVGNDGSEGLFDTIGTYNLNGGSLTATNLRIGGNLGPFAVGGTGIFTQRGGTNTIAETLLLSANIDGTGTYDLIDGQLSAAEEHIGYQGEGSFTQSGGSNTVSESEYIGYRGTYTQTGGTNTIAAFLYVGDSHAATGTYNLSGGQLSARNQFIGSLSGAPNNSVVRLGAFIQSGGTNTASEMLLLGESASSSGTYNLIDGQLSAQEEHVGQSGVGIFTQDGGTNTVSNHLYLAYNSGSTGTYNLEGGQLSATNLYVGRGSAGGAFNQTGGTSACSSLYLGYFSASAGTYNLTNGSLSAANQYIGYIFLTGTGGTSTFTQSGGTNVAGGVLNIGSFSAVGIYNLSGGELKPNDLIIGNKGALNVTDSAASIIIGGNFTIKPLAKFSAVPGATIHMTGSSFDNQSSSMANISGLVNTTFIFEKAVGVHDTFEVASYDYGLVGRGFEDNFVIDGLTLSNTYFSTLQLVDANWNYTANGPRTIGEALYVRTLTLFSHSTLDLNGYHIYAMEYYNYGGEVLNGEVMAMEEHYIPEPATLTLLALGALGVLVGARRRRAH